MPDLFVRKFKTRAGASRFQTKLKQQSYAAILSKNENDEGDSEFYVNYWETDIRTRRFAEYTEALDFQRRMLRENGWSRMNAEVDDNGGRTFLVSY